MGTTIPEFLQQAAREHPDDAFLRLPDETISYARMHDLSERLATSLAQLGVRTGTRVAIAGLNSLEWLATCFAVLRVGGTVVAVNIAYRQHEVEYMLNQSGASVWVCPGRHGDFDYADFVRELRPRVPSVEQVVFLDGTDAGQHRWSELAAAEADPPVIAAAGGDQARPDDPALILYTSGTTGEPKGALLTHRSMLTAAHAQSAHFGHSRDDVLIGHMPISHVGGITCTVLSALDSGSSVALLPSFHPVAAAEAIRERGVTVFIGVPTMYTMTLEAAGLTPADTASVRLCVIGGSPLESALADRTAAAFPSARLANLYGLSEASGACVLSAAEDSVTDISETLGIPVEGVQLRVADEDGNPLPHGETGELQLRGDCVAAGYWNKPEATDAAFGQDGWLATGDLALLRDDDHVVLRGRANDTYIQGGYNIYPAEIESVLARHPAVAMAANIGVPDPIHGKVGHCYVLPRPGRRVAAEELAAFCREHLADYKVPREFTITTELPLTPAGKIHKAELVERPR